MTEHVDIEVITARDPETGETVEAVVIPEGYVCCLMPRENAERYSGWTECAAVRIELDDDGTIGLLEATDDLEALTAPEGAR